MTARRPRGARSPETIGRVPLGFSRDYDHLPRVGPLRSVVCQTCRGSYEDGERQLADGCRVMAVMCWVCRELARARWIEERTKTAALPRAAARF